MKSTVVLILALATVLTAQVSGKAVKDDISQVPDITKVAGQDPGDSSCVYKGRFFTSSNRTKSASSIKRTKSSDSIQDNTEMAMDTSGVSKNFRAPSSTNLRAEQSNPMSASRQSQASEANDVAAALMSDTNHSQEVSEAACCRIL